MRGLTWTDADKCLMKRCVFMVAWCCGGESFLVVRGIVSDGVTFAPVGVRWL